MFGNLSIIVSVPSYSSYLIPVSLKNSDILGSKYCFMVWYVSSARSGCFLPLSPFMHWGSASREGLKQGNLLSSGKKKWSFEKKESIPRNLSTLLISGSGSCKCKPIN